MAKKNEQHIKFEADIGGFKSNIKEAEKSIASLNSTLKLNKAQLAGNSESTELLSKRLETLKEKYNQQQIAIDNTRESYEKAVEVFGENSEEAYKLNKQLTDLQTAQQRTKNEIEKTNSEIEKQSNKFEKAGQKATEWGNNISKLGDKVNKLGNKVSVLSAGMTALIGSSVKDAISFESAWTGVTKTVDGTEEQLESLKKGIIDLSTQLPSTAEEIAEVAENAGQLGIKVDDIENFTKVMIDLGNSTNLSSSEASSALAKFANVTKMSSKDYDKLGSVIVALGNNFATTEADIVAMGTRLAATGELTGLSEAQIMGLATAMSSVGIEAEAGGSAMSKLLKKIQVAVETGSKDLTSFAKVAGMSAKDFKKAYEKDAVKALTAFISGLNDTKRNGKSAIAILDDMGLKEVRLSNTILSLANSSEVMNDAIDLANKSWKENNALTIEATKRYKTTESQIQMTKNKAREMAISLGNQLLPEVNNILDKTGKWIDKLDDLSDEQKQSIINIGLMVTAAGPLLKMGGSAISLVGNVTKGVGTLSQAIGVLKTETESANTSANLLAKGIGALTSPTTLALVGITAAVATVAIAIKNAEKDAKEAFSNMGNSASDFIKGIDTAQSHLDAFNEELFISAEEQQNMKEQMDECQKGITAICKTASEERRALSEDEIQKFDDYFTKLRELNQREVELQKQISIAITQQAQTNAEAFEGSLEEYKIQSQEWLKTAEEQKTKTIELINRQTVEEIALLNLRYETEESRQTEEYQEEYDRIITQKDAKIAQANDEVSKINSTYLKGYLERSKQNDSFYQKIEEYNSKIEEENKRHNNVIDNIENSALLNQYNKNQSKYNENYTHQENMKDIWNKMYKDMSEEQEKELGTWLAMVSQTELYGGKIDEETRKIVDSILDSYDSMPKGTQEAMKNAMQPMIEEMQKKEPTLFAKASNIAEGILNRLKKSFDIHSPSKKTRKIFNQMMQGGELGIEDEEDKLYKQVDALSDNMNKKLASIGFNKGKISSLSGSGGMNIMQSNSIVDGTKTIFTTPQITFNVQELDENKLQQCFNYINRKFGSQY